MNDSTPTGQEPTDISHLQAVDFKTLKDRASEKPRWLVEPLIPAGRGTAIVSAGGQGKSLLLLEVAAALATGQSVLKQNAGVPTVVVYVDQEMGESDLAERLESLGYDYSADTVLQEHLHYYQLQGFRPLDTKGGGDELLAIVDHHQAKLVILDTLIRLVEGEENSSNTVASFHQHVGIALKGRGVTYVRADHSGRKKDGGRGSSAKDDDVDVTWTLEVTETKKGFDILRFKIRKRRMNWVPKTFQAHRKTYPLTTHEVPSTARTISTNEIVVAMESAPPGLMDGKRPEIQRWLREDRGLKFSNQAYKQAHEEYLERDRRRWR